MSSKSIDTIILFDGYDDITIDLDILISTGSVDLPKGYSSLDDFKDVYGKRSCYYVFNRDNVLYYGSVLSLFSELSGDTGDPVPKKEVSDKYHFKVLKSVTKEISISPLRGYSHLSDYALCILEINTIISNLSDKLILE